VGNVNDFSGLEDREFRFVFAFMAVECWKTDAVI
jgi:hypothetical protein